ncbi:MAG: DUF523 domain-containing protein [Desulfuromonas sp.]|nr:MAG: DUF523 domain-containing protein [Desulfuromonas sp.]
MSQSKARTPILVSACLLGIACRYDGRAKPNSAVSEHLARHDLLAIPVCPEQLGGLPTPREPTRFSRGDGQDILTGHGEVVTHSGKPLTEPFRKGAEQTLLIARLCGCQSALLKERSPSCGVNQIDCDGHIVAGIGVASARLKAEGLQVFSEEDLPRGEE